MPESYEALKVLGVLNQPWEWSAAESEPGVPPERTVLPTLGREKARCCLILLHESSSGVPVSSETARKGPGILLQLRKQVKPVPLYRPRPPSSPHKIALSEPAGPFTGIYDRVRAAQRPRPALPSNLTRGERGSI